MKKKSPPFAPGIIESFKTIWRSISREHAAFIIVCIYLVFEYNKPQSIYPALDIIPWGLTLLVIGTILSLGFSRPLCQTLLTFLPLVAFSCCVLASMEFAFSSSIAINTWKRFFPWLLVIWLVTRVVNTRQRFFLFITVYFLCNFKMAQHAFISWATRGFTFTTWGVTGSPGWFQNSGEFSLEMVVFLPLLLMYILVFHNNWSKSVRMAFYLFAIMVIGSIVASSNRGAIVGLCILGLWGLICSRNRVKTFILIALAAALIYGVMPKEFLARFETVGDDNTSLSRLAYWQCGIDAIRSAPIFGIGIGNWGAWALANHPELLIFKGSWAQEVEVLHNTYLEAGTELGLSGAMAYFLILVQIFFTNRQSAQLAGLRHDKFLKSTALGLNGGLIAYITSSYFMSVLYYPYVWILLSLTICLSSVCHTADLPFNPQEEQEDFHVSKL